MISMKTLGRAEKVGEISLREYFKDTELYISLYYRIVICCFPDVYWLNSVFLF